MIQLAHCFPFILDLSEIIWYHGNLFFKKEKLIIFLRVPRPFSKVRVTRLLAQLSTDLMQGSSSYSNLDRFLVAPKESQHSSL